MRYVVRLWASRYRIIGDTRSPTRKKNAKNSRPFCDASTSPRSADTIAIARNVSGSTCMTVNSLRVSRRSVLLLAGNCVLVIKREGYFPQHPSGTVRYSDTYVWCPVWYCVVHLQALPTHTRARSPFT